MIAIDKDPDFIDAKLGLARNYIELWNRDIDDLDRFDLVALELLGEIREQRPGHLSAQIMELLMRYYVASFEKQTWEVDPANQAFIDDMYALALTGDIEPYLTHRVVNLISGFPRYQDEEALELLRGAIEADPLNFELLWAQANLFRATDRPEQAKQPLLTAATVAPENPRIPMSLASLAKSQFNFAEALEWFRQAMVLDPNDPAIPVNIAFAFYDLEFVEEGDYWADKVRAMEPEQCLISILDVETAELHGDTDRLTELLTRDLALAISEQGVCYFPVNYFVRTMSEQGRSQQGLDILSELIPEITDYSNVILDNRRAQYIQSMSVLLYYDILEFADFQELYTTAMDAYTEAVPTWREVAAPFYEILYDGTSGDRDYAKKLFFETHGDPLDMSGGRWKQFLQAAPLEDFRQDPEVAAVIEKYYELRAKNIEGVRKLLDTPDWQR